MFCWLLFCGRTKAVTRFRVVVCEGQRTFYIYCRVRDKFRRSSANKLYMGGTKAVKIKHVQQCQSLGNGTKSMISELVGTWMRSEIKGHVLDVNTFPNRIKLGRCIINLLASLPLITSFGITFAGNHRPKTQQRKLASFPSN